MAATGNNHNISDHQHRLSEHLQLLLYLRYSDGQMPYPSGLPQRSEIVTTLHILDTICVALTTGQPGDVFAAAFDRRQGLKLVLAKNDHHTDEDDQAVRDLIKVVTASSTKDAYDVFPFLLSRCGKNMERRMMKMVEALSAFSQDLDEILMGYFPHPSLDEEFPKSADYRQKTYPHDDPSVPQMMRQLLEEITNTATGFNPEHSDASKRKYVRLVTLIPLLQNSRLLRSMCVATDYKHLTRKLQADRLDRRLAKVLQYYRGINSLIKHAKHSFPEGLVHQWVEPITGTGASRVELENYPVVISRALGEPSSQSALSMVEQRLPQLAQNWRNQIFTRVHAEIRILLHLSDSGALGRLRQQPIGCSKRSCLGCALWLAAYNTIFKTELLTSGSHGKPYATWALPGCSYAHVRVSNGRSVVDNIVMDGVEKRLIDTLDWMIPGTNRLSDEYRSESESGPESDDSITQR